jgi:hypothetical protein
MGAMMDRRLALTALACWPATGLLAQDAEPLPQFRISTRALGATLQERFPVRLAANGLFELQVDAPRLRALPASQQLAVLLEAELRGAQLQRPQRGDLDLAFGLRYEAADRTLRARDLQVLALRWPGLDPDTAALAQALVPALVREGMGEIVLHRFTQRELALADTMGFEPQRASVDDDGVVITFGPKRRP